jgi:hypothetical protein
MILVAGRQMSRMALFATRPATSPAVLADAPSIQPKQAETPVIPARTSEVAG